MTPFLLERAPSMCARRLRRHFQGLRGDEGDFTRGRIRDPLVEDARAAQREMGPPNRASFSVRPDLLPEEQALQARAIDHYLELFSDEELRTLDDPAWDRPVESNDGEFQVGGWIDLVGQRADGRTELRQFELWGRSLEADPHRSFTMLLAALRIRKHLRIDRLEIRHADLVTGTRHDRSVDFAHEGEELNSRFHRRMAQLRLREQRGETETTPGMDCVTCPFVAGCPAHG